MQVLINIDVEDLNRGIRFYEAAAGLQLLRRLFEGTVAELGGANTTIYLVESKTASLVVPDSEIQRSFTRHWTPVHLDFIVDNINEASRCALAAGATQQTEIRDFPWGQLATFSDPFGNGFCFVQFPAEPYARELVG